MHCWCPWKKLVAGDIEFVRMSELQLEIEVRRLVKYSVSIPLLELFGIMYCGKDTIDSDSGIGSDEDVIFGMMTLANEVIVGKVFDGAITNLGGGGSNDCVDVMEMLSGILIGNMLLDEASIEDVLLGILFFIAARLVSK
jgi:hypothetical protein